MNGHPRPTNIIYLPSPHNAWTIIELPLFKVVAVVTAAGSVQVYNDTLCDTNGDCKVAFPVRTKAGFLMLMFNRALSSDYPGVAIIWKVLVPVEVI